MFFKYWRIKRKISRDYGKKLAPFILRAHQAAHQAAKLGLMGKSAEYFFLKLLWGVQHHPVSSYLTDNQAKFSELWKERHHVPLQKVDVQLLWYDLEVI